MTKDLNKGVSSIQYNILNLPKQMDIKSPVAEARNVYTYSAGGAKLRVVQKWNPNYSTAPVLGSGINENSLTKTKTTDYAGNISYESHSDGTTKTKILIDGGYIENGVYHFYLVDHLGNNRVVVDQSGAIIQKNNYYPFGMAFSDNNNAEKQSYKYNGKELDQMHGLNLYDYHARYYDSAIDRFTTMDPLAESFYSWSPYVYVMNNPINAVDLKGDSIWYTVDNDIITMHITAKLINYSSDNINMERATKDITKGIKNSFSGEVSIEGKSYAFQTDIQLDAVVSMNDVVDTDHLFVLGDVSGNLGRGVINIIGGKVMTIAASDYANNNWFSNTLSRNNTRSAVHEFGHAAGLEHFVGSGGKNLMKQKVSGMNINQEQREMLLKYSHNKINQGPNHISIFGGRKIPYPYIHYYEKGWQTAPVSKSGLKHIH